MRQGQWTWNAVPTLWKVHKHVQACAVEDHNLSVFQSRRSFTFSGRTQPPAGVESSPRELLLRQAPTFSPGFNESTFHSSQPTHLKLEASKTSPPTHVWGPFTLKFVKVSVGIFLVGFPAGGWESLCLGQAPANWRTLSFPVDLRVILRTSAKSPNNW